MEPASEQGEGLRQLLAGDLPARPPLLFWKHFRDDRPYQLARLTVDFYRRHRLAAAKLMPDIPILFEDFALSSWRQLAHLRGLGPTLEVGRAREYLATAGLVRRQLSDRDLLLVTVFSPLARVGLWSGPDGLREMAEARPHVVHAVLRTLAELSRGLAAESLRAGADGIYYSCWGQDVLDPDQYREYGTPYDLAGLAGADSAELNVLHVHGALTQPLSRYRDYPVQVVGWSEVDSSIDLPGGSAALAGKVIMGGIPERWEGPEQGLPTAAGARLEVLLAELGPGFVFAPGCSLPDALGDATLGRLRALVGGVAGAGPGQLPGTRAGRPGGAL